jgi:hypothetical protein
MSPESWGEYLGGLLLFVATFFPFGVVQAFSSGNYIGRIVPSIPLALKARSEEEVPLFWALSLYSLA